MSTRICFVLVVKFLMLLAMSPYKLMFCPTKSIHLIAYVLGRLSRCFGTKSRHLFWV